MYFAVGDNRDNSNDSTKDIGAIFPKIISMGTARLYLDDMGVLGMSCHHFSRAGAIN